MTQTRICLPAIAMLAIALSWTSLAQTSLAADDAKPSKPNIVIIYMDDMGYADLSCYGATAYKTPNIDSLAAGGVRFTDFYSPYCVCSASRASLLTGSYQPRLSMRGVLGPHSSIGLHPDEVTFADLAKTKGYATQCIGKWHVGDKPETLPTAQGFDHYFGLPYSNDMARTNKLNKNNPESLDKAWTEKAIDDYNGELYRDNEIIENPVDQRTLTKRYTDESIRFIRENQDGPFLLYLAHTMVHVPLFVRDENWDPDPNQAFKLVMQEVDESVRRVVTALDELGLRENTLIFFSSDNGPWLSKDHHAGSALPLRSGKATTYDGGMRVAGIFNWPGVIESGRTCSEVAGSIDIVPTIAELIGAPLPADRPVDGRSIMPLLMDENARSPHLVDGLYYYRNSVPEAIRLGKWKLREVGKSTELYDLEADISEENNLAESQPEVVAQLRKVRDRYNADLKANTRPTWKDETPKQ